MSNDIGEIYAWLDKKGFQTLSFPPRGMSGNNRASDGRSPELVARVRENSAAHEPPS